MTKYFVKTPWWLKKLFPHRLWSINTKEKTIYLTFDDGPHTSATNFVLDELRKFNAKATFFCIGKNVTANPTLYDQIIKEGHSVGNHTYNHLNGWQTDTSKYFSDIESAASVINSDLFRPPYGRIRSSQAGLLGKYRIVMWDVLSGDFDEQLPKEKCLNNVIKNVMPGSVVVFHDSEKAFEKLTFVLPKVLEYFTEKGFRFRRIETKWQ
ncbi:MAG TPA: polysaccharide deacetylase family protein [Chitinophagaceae bacterium]|mgnify:CR=1 FL=1|nr:polysaccharide deacetylase family protein [Chitinophagaceae bacterium]